MRNTVVTPAYRYLALEKACRHKVAVRTLKECMNRSNASCKTFHSVSPNVSSKTLLDFSKSRPIVNHWKKYSVVSSRRTELMEFPIYPTPSLFCSISKMLNTFKMRNLDNEFDFAEFQASSKTALAVVTRLLSEMRFSQLEGLIADECKPEVERNVRAMDTTQRYGLVVDESDIYYSFAHENEIIRGGADGEKIFYQVRMVYHCCKNFAELMKVGRFERIHQSNLEMFTIYNCRFIREFTPGIDGQWIINGINLYKAHEDPSFEQHKEQ